MHKHFTGTKEISRPFVFVLLKTFDLFINVLGKKFAKGKKVVKRFFMKNDKQYCS